MLTSGAGNDVLDGGAGIDELTGGFGDDLFIIDALDTVLEGGGQGSDTVEAGFSYVLGEDIEKLVLTGVAVEGFGNALANSLTLVGGTLSGVKLASPSFRSLRAAKRRFISTESVPSMWRCNSAFGRPAMNSAFATMYRLLFDRDVGRSPSNDVANPVTEIHLCARLAKRLLWRLNLRRFASASLRTAAPPSFTTCQKMANFRS
jgi:hypothetical protein